MTEAVPMVGGDAVRVLVVDDHALFRRGLDVVLADEPDIEIVGEAADGAEAVEQASLLAPDIVLMDVRMPRRSGIEACTAIKTAVPTAKIIMLTISDEEADLYEAIKAGAMGYLLKEISIQEVAEAIRAGAGRSVADQPVDGEQAAHRVRDDGASKDLAKPTRCRRRGSPTARWRS